MQNQGLAVTLRESFGLDQIAVGRNRLWRSSGRVNLVYTIEVERVGAFDRNRIAIPIKRDPL